MLVVKWFTFSVIYLDSAKDQIFIFSSDAYNFSPDFKNFVLKLLNLFSRNWNFLK
jgi:hypothetical protein